MEEGPGYAGICPDLSALEELLRLDGVKVSLVPALFQPPHHVPAEVRPAAAPQE